MREMKDSGIEWIGEIPKDKNLVRNKYMFNYIKGKLPKNTNKNGKGFPYIGASDLESSSDVYEVVTFIEKTMKKKYSIEMKREVIVIGSF